MEGPYPSTLKKWGSVGKLFTLPNFLTGMSCVTDRQGEFYVGRTQQKGSTKISISSPFSYIKFNYILYYTSSYSTISLYFSRCIHSNLILG